MGIFEVPLKSFEVFRYNMWHRRGGGKFMIKLPDFNKNTYNAGNNFASDSKGEILLRM